ncbi:hypothetical protein J8273_0283 [Carpediemonas membranifera]|uniref:Uncharacterized protein n=1 Tax=Carpediemonas membranifera TaxID=201153 RepID=A0A8J6BD91_9EUKA|nr:hypothetical protein J8273_0283 [Carpediemonas membranifera]|eukprot:KAG9395067.1 hypothetical protein J8273_0283 [Carpediemonas membranifera]
MFGKAANARPQTALTDITRRCNNELEEHLSRLDVSSSSGVRRPATTLHVGRRAKTTHPGKWNETVEAIFATIDGEAPVRPRDDHVADLTRPDNGPDMAAMSRQHTESLDDEHMTTSKRLQLRMAQYRDDQGRKELEARAAVVRSERAAAFVRSYGRRNMIVDNKRAAGARTPDLVRTRLEQRAEAHNARLEFVVKHNKEREQMRRELVLSRSGRRDNGMTALQRLAVRSTALQLQRGRWRLATAMLARHQAIVSLLVSVRATRLEQVKRDTAATLVQTAWRGKILRAVQARREAAMGSIQAVIFSYMLRRRVQSKARATTTVVEFIAELRHTAGINTAIRQFRWCVVTVQRTYRRHRLSLEAKEVVLTRSLRDWERVWLTLRLTRERDRALKEARKKKAAASSQVVKAALKKQKRKAVTDDDVDALRQPDNVIAEHVARILAARVRAVALGEARRVSPLIDEDESFALLETLPLPDPPAPEPEEY